MKAIVLSAILFASPQDTLVLSLEDAVSRAVLVSPRLAAAEAAVYLPRGLKSAGRLPFPDNPRVEYGRARRAGPDTTVNDYEWRISQEIELAGQWFLRSEAAQKGIEAAEAGVVDARRLAALEARLAYVLLRTAERRTALADSNAAFAERLSGFAEAQFEAGEINLLEVNTAVLEAARTASQASRVLAAQRAAAAQLSRILGTQQYSVVTTLPLPAIPDLSLDDAGLLELAATRRPDLDAARLARQGAAKAVSAAQRGIFPNLELTGFSSVEELGDLLGFSASIRVPLFQRRQGRVGLAKATRGAAQAAVTAVERQVHAEVRSARALFVNAREAERRFAAQVLQAAAQNVALTTRAFEEGEVGIAQVVVFRTAAIAAQLEYLDVLTDTYRAWFELAAAVGAHPDQLSELLGASER